MLFYNRKAVCLKQRQQGTVVCRILLGHQLVGHHVQLIQLLGGGKPRNILFGIFRIYHVLQRCHAHHEKLIQVGCGNA